MTKKQEIFNLERVTERAIIQLRILHSLTNEPLTDIETALAELQDGVAFLKERLDNVE